MRGFVLTARRLCVPLVAFFLEIPEEEDPERDDDDDDSDGVGSWACARERGVEPLGVFMG